MMRLSHFRIFVRFVVGDFRVLLYRDEGMNYSVYRHIHTSFNDSISESRMFINANVPPNITRWHRPSNKGESYVFDGLVA